MKKLQLAILSAGILALGQAFGQQAPTGDPPAQTADTRDQEQSRNESSDRKGMKDRGMMGGMGMHMGMGGSGMEGMGCPHMRSIADVQVEHTAEGAVVRLTAKNREDVEQVRQHAQMMGRCMGGGGSDARTGDGK